MNVAGVEYVVKRGEQIARPVPVSKLTTKVSNIDRLPYYETIFSKC